MTNRKPGFPGLFCSLCSVASEAVCWYPPHLLGISVGIATAFAVASQYETPTKPLSGTQKRGVERDDTARKASDGGGFMCAGRRLVCPAAA